jgi:hypothetical protein
LPPIDQLTTPKPTALRVFVLSSYPFTVSRVAHAVLLLQKKYHPMVKAQVRLKHSSTRRLGPKGLEAASSGNTPLNFKVPLDFRREFKTYAAQHNKKLNQLLYEAFAALKGQK